MTNVSHLPLADGTQLPQIGLGTWPLTDDEAAVAVADALRVGYRLIDTAARYGNETGVGRGIRDSGVSRKDIILTTKLRGADHGYDKTLRAFDASLKRLGVDELDLYLIHWPQPQQNLYVESWKAFVRLKEEGRIRSIGVSNFLPEHIDRLVDETGVLPAVDQIELHPEFAQPVLRQQLCKRGVVIESWSPLGRGAVLSSKVVQELALKHGRTAAQVILRWHLQQGLIAIPKSQKPERIRENFDVFGFALDQDDLAAMATLDINHRTGGDPATFAED